MPRKQQEITVSVIRRADRELLVYRWRDRVAGTSGEETAGTASKRAARSHDRLGAFIESIKARRVPKTTDPEWTVFRARYERSQTGWRGKTLKSWATAAGRFEGIVQPVRLSDLNAGAIDEFRVALHGQVSPTTVSSYLRMLRAAARWAATIYPGYVPPPMKLARAVSRGRPLTGEEFDKMLSACSDVVPRHAGSWRFVLKGLVWSGLRLQQALDLSWDVAAPIHLENLDGPHPRLHIAAAGHKGGRDEQLPLVPPLVKLLRQVPHRRREGYVFNPKHKRGVVRNVNAASAMIAKIGRQAGIVTGTRIARRKNKDTGQWEIAGTVPSFASAHDLKRTFVERLLSLGFHPAKIAQLAQHRTFEVTAQHYAGHDVRELSEYAQGLFAASEREP